MKSGAMKTVLKSEVRAWVERQAGTLLIGVAWAFAFAMILALPEAELPPEYRLPVLLLAIAVSLLSFGVCWIYRNERGER